MALVTGPLMSVAASGKYAGSIVFTTWKGRPVARQFVKPSNPKTAMQTGLRAMMGFLSAAWASLAALSQASYDSFASAANISSFNAFCGKNQNLWTQSETPTQLWPAAKSSSGITITTQTLTGGNGQVTLSITPSGSTSLWGFVIYRDTAEITTPTWANAVAVIEADGSNAVTYVDSGLDAGTYHYRVGAFNVDGTKGTVHADGTATAT
jgi:hypothetical protein